MKRSLTIFLLLASLDSHAALHKWVDAEGKIHYSDMAPSDVKVQTLKSATTSDSITPASGINAPKTLAEREAEWKKSQKAKEEAEKKSAKEQENASIKQKNCEVARNNLSTLENSPVIATYNSSGERSFMDDTARKQSTEDARKAVSTYCN